MRVLNWSRPAKGHTSIWVSTRRNWSEPVVTDGKIIGKKVCYGDATRFQKFHRISGRRRSFALSLIIINIGFNKPRHSRHTVYISQLRFYSISLVRKITVQRSILSQKWTIHLPISANIDI